MCSLGYEGKGYSPEFVAGFSSITNRLRGSGGDQIEIEVVGGLDSICIPCPNNQGSGCATQEKIDALDKAHSEALCIALGELWTWGDMKKRIREWMTIETFHRICAPCEWKKLGICESALRKHLDT